MANHRAAERNRDPHVIEQGADWYVLRAVYFDDPPSTMPDLTEYTATYVVFPHGDPSLEPVIALGTSGGMTIAYADGTETTTTTAGITLGLAGADEVVTTLGGSAVEGASTVTVASASGLAIGDHLAIWLNDGSIHITSIANLVSTTVTLAVPLGGAATSGNAVKGYDAAYMLHNIELHLSGAVTTDLTNWGTGLYQLHLIDGFGHVQPVMADTCCLERGHGHG